MRDKTVPKSLDVQRTNAKMLPGANDRDASIAVQDLLRDGATKPNAVLDALFEPEKFDLREISSCSRSEFWKLSDCLAAVRLRRRIVAGLNNQAWLDRRTDLDGLPQRIESARSVRRNPKDFWLEELRRLESAGPQGLWLDSGPR